MLQADAFSLLNKMGNCYGAAYLAALRSGEADRHLESHFHCEFV